MIKDNVLDEIKNRLSYIINDEEVGYLDYEKIYEVVNITDVYVHENYRNKKIGSNMLEYLINKYENVRFMLEVRESNNYAIKLYEKYGFKVIHRRKKYYKDEDALIMEVSK